MQKENNSKSMFLSGLSYFKNEEFNSALAMFEQAVNAAPNNALYRFYLMVSLTKNFKNINELFSYQCVNPKYRQQNFSSENILNDFVKKSLVLLQPNEKEYINKEFNLNFIDEKTFVISLFKKVLASLKPTTLNNYKTIEKVYVLLTNEEQKCLNPFLINHFSNIEFKKEEIENFLGLLSLLKQNLSKEEYLPIEFNMLKF